LVRKPKDFDPRPLVTRYVKQLVDDARRISNASFPKQLQAGSLADVEASHLQRVLEACEGNKSDAARILQIDRRSLQRKLQRLAHGVGKRRASAAKRKAR
jgi:ActR/RegA family two-component response regulator